MIMLPLRAIVYLRKLQWQEWRIVLQVVGQGGPRDFRNHIEYRYYLWWPPRTQRKNYIADGTLDTGLEGMELDLT